MIYIVEPKPTKRRMLINALQRASIEAFREFDSGNEALSHLDFDTPVFIILGDNLPDMTPVAFAKRIRQSTTYQHIPVVLVSDRDEQDYVLGALENGIDDYLLTPFDAEALGGKARAALTRSKVRKEQVARAQRVEARARAQGDLPAEAEFLDASLDAAASRMPVRKRRRSRR